MKRIYTFLDYNLEVRGGAQFSSLLIIEKLKEEFEFIVVMPGKSICPSTKTILIKSYEYLPSVFKKPFTYFKILIELIKVLKNEDIDIYHCQMPVSLTLIGLLKKFKLIQNKPLIYTDRGLFEDYHLVNKLLIKYLFKQINTFITTTNKNYEDWNRYLKSNKITTIYNTSFTCFEEKPTIYEKEKKVLKVGFSGRYCEIKDWPLAEAICINLSKYKQVYINMAIGTFNEEDVKAVNNLRNRLLSYFDDMRIDIKMNLELEQMKNFFQDIDIFISTSKNESFGRVAVEAMSQHCCVFGKRVGGLQEVIGDELFLYSDLEEISNKLDKLILDNTNLFNYKEKC